MKFPGLLILAMTLALAPALPAIAQEATQPNHLDCRPVDGSDDLSCPSVDGVQTGRAAADGNGQTARTDRIIAAPGTDEWRAACAAKFRSFNPETGTYRAFSGEERVCN